MIIEQDILHKDEDGFLFHLPAGSWSFYNYYFKQIMKKSEKSDEDLKDLKYCSEKLKAIERSVGRWTGKTSYS